MTASTSSSELAVAREPPAEPAGARRLQSALVAAIAQYTEHFQRDERFAPLGEHHGLTRAQIAGVCSQMLRTTGMTAFDIAGGGASDQWEETVYVVGT